MSFALRYHTTLTMVILASLFAVVALVGAVSPVEVTMALQCAAVLLISAPVFAFLEFHIARSYK